MINYAQYTQSEIKDIISELISLRIKIFREFPYLYDGVEEDEFNYLTDFAEREGAYVAVAILNDTVIGAITVVPMQFADDDIRKGFSKTAYNPLEFCYYGEIMLYKEFRGDGIGGKMVAMANSYAASIGAPNIALCTVVRPDNHPYKPQDYRSVTELLVRNNFTKHPEANITLSWRRVDGGENIKSTLIFWVGIE